MKYIEQEFKIVFITWQINVEIILFYVNFCYKENHCLVDTILYNDFIGYDVIVRLEQWKG